MGDGPYYHHYKPIHLCFFEVPGTIKKLLNHHEILIDNSDYPSTSVAAITKRPLLKGDFIKKGTGSFDTRGSAVRIIDESDHVPIGLLQNTRIRENMEVGQIIRFSDVDIPPSMATKAWFDTIECLEVNLNNVPKLK
jgi:predicted homoserine dehydrogenase-like protein